MELNFDYIRKPDNLGLFDIFIKREYRGDGTEVTKNVAEVAATEEMVYQICAALNTCLTIGQDAHGCIDLYRDMTHRTRKETLDI